MIRIKEHTVHTYIMYMLRLPPTVMMIGAEEQNADPSVLGCMNRSNPDSPNMCVCKHVYPYTSYIHTYIFEPSWFGDEMTVHTPCGYAFKPNSGTDIPS
jgi:hypothetical protein